MSYGLTNACLHKFKYMDQKASATMMPIKSLAGITPAVNLRNPLRTGDEVAKYKGSILSLKPGVDVTRSPKERYQRSHKKECCLPKIIQKY